MKVKKNISIDDNLRDKATKKAEKMGMSFSAYITYLINKDIGEIAITEETDTTKDKKVSNGIDAILGI